MPKTGTQAWVHRVIDLVNGFLETWKSSSTSFAPISGSFLRKDGVHLPFILTDTERTISADEM